MFLLNFESNSVQFPLEECFKKKNMNATKYLSVSSVRSVFVHLRGSVVPKRNSSVPTGS